MSLSNSILVYVMLWVVTLFLVLPWGIQQADATGAPLHPRVGLKLLLTTIIAGVLWGGIYLLFPGS